MGRKSWIIALAVLALAILLTLAWIDGGSEPMRWIEIPVAVPEAER